jgi:diamine N-acetyltransferase
MDASIQIRQAVVSDVPRLSVLYKTVYIDTYGLEGVSTEFCNFISDKFSEERLAQVITESPDLTFVATFKGNLVWVAEIELNRPCPIGSLVAPELSKLYVLNRFKGMGIGKRLIAEVESFLKAGGHPNLWLWAYALNSHALAFYKMNGYTDIGNAFFQLSENRYENRVFVKALDQ